MHSKDAIDLKKCDQIAWSTGAEGWIGTRENTHPITRRFEDRTIVSLLKLEVQWSSLENPSATLRELHQVQA